MKRFLRWHFYEKFKLDVSDRYLLHVDDLIVGDRYWFFFCDQKMLSRSMGLALRKQFVIASDLGFVPVLVDTARFVDLLCASGEDVVARFVSRCHNLQMISDIFRFFVMFKYGGVYKDVFSGWDPSIYKGSKKRELLLALGLEGSIPLIGLENNISFLDTSMRKHPDLVNNCAVWQLSSSAPRHPLYEKIWVYFRRVIIDSDCRPSRIPPLCKFEAVKARFPSMQPHKINVLIRTGPIAFTYLVNSLYQPGLCEFASCDFGLQCSFPYKGRVYVGGGFCQHQYSGLET